MLGRLLPAPELSREPGALPKCAISPKPEGGESPGHHPQLGADHPTLTRSRSRVGCRTCAPPTAAMAMGTQLGLLLWKNFTYRRRQRVSGKLGQEGTPSR